MKTTLSNFLIFTAGVGIGVAATWQFFKTKYERIAQEEIDSVKDVYSTKRPDGNSSKQYSIEKFEKTVDDMRAYVAKVSENGYGDYEESLSNIKNNEEVVDMDKPRVISPDEFDAIDDTEYEINTLIFYADGVLSDDFNNRIEDVDFMVGSDWINHFGEYDEDKDTVYVVNEKLKKAYEILLDEELYSNVHPVSYQVEEVNDAE
jgi:hypothetical protein